MPEENSPAEFDLELLAEQAVDLLAVSPGQVIWIWASTYSLDLIASLAFRIRQRGAFWTLRLVNEQLLQRVGLEVPDEYLSYVPEHELRWLGDMHGIIEVHDHGGSIPGVPISRRRALAGEWIALIDEANRRGLRRINICNPTSALAEAYGIPLDTLRQRYWQAINIDHQLLDKCQTRISNLLSRTSEVHLTCASGSDLWLRIAGRPVHRDTDGLPRGEVYVAPHEDSANGLVVIKQATICGRPIRHLQLTFSAGRVVDIQAPEPGAADTLRELLAVSTGDMDQIAEFAIGLNPGVSQLTGDTRLDEKIYASVHIAIGANQSFGGHSQSNMHLDMVILQPTFWCDGKIRLEQGLFWLDHEEEDGRA